MHTNRVGIRVGLISLGSVHIGPHKNELGGPVRK